MHNSLADRETVNSWLDPDISGASMYFFPLKKGDFSSLFSKAGSGDQAVSHSCKEPSSTERVRRGHWKAFHWEVIIQAVRWERPD